MYGLNKIIQLTLALRTRCLPIPSHRNLVFPSSFSVSSLHGVSDDRIPYLVCKMQATPRIPDAMFCWSCTHVYSSTSGTRLLSSYRQTSFVVWATWPWFYGTFPTTSTNWYFYGSGHHPKFEFWRPGLWRPRILPISPNHCPTSCKLLPSIREQTACCYQGSKEIIHPLLWPSETLLVFFCSKTACGLDWVRSCLSSTWALYYCC